MNTSRHNAPNASIRISHMRRAYRPWKDRPVMALISALATAAVLVACGTFAPLPTTPAASPPEMPASTADSPTALPSPSPPPPPAPIGRGVSRWVAANWADLPGWQADRALEVWTALRRSCDRPAAGWERACADAARRAPTDDTSARAWLMLNMGVYRVESSSGEADGLITGYFEPFIEASRTPTAAFSVPLFQAPADLATRVPYWTRQQLDTLPAARAALKGREIAYVADAMDALVLQIQGSGRLRIAEPDGKVQTVRLAFAGHNGHGYSSVGRWLIDRGEMRADAASWPTIREWARRHPKQVNEMLWSNPRTVFFREEPLPDPDLGPRGAQGVPLTPGRSIAVDPRSIPYGTLVWLDTTEPLSSTPLQRLVVAQDTGSAIVGAVRADYFWGWAGEAEAMAGRMKQPLRMWTLWPKS